MFANKSHNISAAALSITTLYRSSRKTSKRAYNAGYGAACQDLLNFIQQGLSTGGVGPTADAPDGGVLTIGRVMDWTEARLEAIRATEEEEDEEEEREKDRSSSGTNSRQAVAVVPAATVAVRASNAHASASAPASAPASPKVAVKRSVPPRHKDIVCYSPVIVVSDTIAHGHDN